jgi:hypothetical protein
MRVPVGGTGVPIQILPAEAVRVAERWVIACPDCNEKYVTGWRRHVPRYCTKCKGTRPIALAACIPAEPGGAWDLAHGPIRYRVVPIEGAADRFHELRKAGADQMLEAIESDGEREEG